MNSVQLLRVWQSDKRKFVSIQINFFFLIPSIYLPVVLLLRFFFQILLNLSFKNCFGNVKIKTSIKSLVYVLGENVEIKICFNTSVPTVNEFHQTLLVTFERTIKLKSLGKY
jgi:hypothetical protein